MEKINAMVKAAEASGDEQFFIELRAIVNAGDGKPDVNAIIKFAATRGYDITEADWNEYYEQDQKEKRAKLGKTEELCEEELETVAGGILGKKDSHRCFLVTGAWTMDKTQVHCRAASCWYLEISSFTEVWCHCKGGNCNHATATHKLSVLDKNGKCPHQDGYIGGPPPAGSL